jgi:hypothetical protein
MVKLSRFVKIGSKLVSSNICIYRGYSDMLLRLLIPLLLGYLISKYQDHS